MGHEALITKLNLRYYDKNNYRQSRSGHRPACVASAPPIVKRLAREGAHKALTYVSKPDRADDGALNGPLIPLGFP
jgi:hypothetical protein